MLCRSLEDEVVRMPAPLGNIDRRLNYLVALSNHWIGAAYAITFAFSSRDLFKTEAGFQDIAEDLRIIRVQLEKHEIASDRDLDEPLDLQTDPGQGGITKQFQYDPKNRLRAHIGRSGVSARGSVTWEVIDVRANNAMRWLERRELSDRLLQALVSPRPTQA